MKVPFYLLVFLVLSALPRQALSEDTFDHVFSADQLNVYGGVVSRSSERTPLLDAFKDLHFEATLGLLAHVRNGLHLSNGDSPQTLLSGNPSGAFNFGRWIEVARYFDFLNVELNIAALAEDRDHYLAVNALAESVGSALLVMPDAASNAQWRENEDPFAYVRGTGFAYAFGSHMHVPWCLYDGSQYHRFYGSPEGHQPIFRMIAENTDFIDGYVPLLWNLLEVPYGDRGIASLKRLESLLGAFFEAGVPTVVRLRHEDQLGADFETKLRLSRIDRERFGPDRFMGKPHSVVALGGRHPAGAESPFQLGESYRLQYYPPVPRVSAEPSNAPLVLHLLQRADSGAPSEDPVSFSILPALLGGAEVVGVDLAAVGWNQGSEAQVSWEMDKNGGLVIRVEGVEGWGMVRVRTAGETAFPRLMRDPLREQMAESEAPLMRMIRFSDKWRRPPWVDALLASSEDPLDGYFIDRISWSYDVSPDTLRHAAEKGWAFHGSVGLLHSWMANPERKSPKAGDTLAFPPDWPGWVRYPGGDPMLIRAEWNPPRYGASFASPDYREAVLQRCLEWVEKGASGIQLDDVSGMLNRVWQYGGDFSDVFFEGFREALVEQGFPGVTTETSVEELRRRVVREAGWVNASRRVDVSEPGMDEGMSWITVPFQATSDYYPGQVWINSPVQEAIGVVRAEWSVRFEGGQAPHGDFRLLDGFGTEWFAACAIRGGRLFVYTPADSLKDTGITLAPYESTTIGMEFDFGAGIFRVRLGKGVWDGPYPFYAPWPAELTTFMFNAMADPLRTGMMVRGLRVERTNKL